MNSKLVAILLAGASLAPLTASAQTAAPAAAPASPHTFTGNATIASEYIYRGIAQTNRKPAIQGGFDYSHADGFYMGLWGSSITWLSDVNAWPGAAAAIGAGTTQAISSGVEIDLYGGFKGNIGKSDWTWDVGLLHYNYPGSFPSALVPKNPNTTEVYGAIGWKFVSLKYSHAVTDIFGWFHPTTLENSKNSGYLDLGLNYDLGDGWGVNAHVGHQSIKNFSDASYTDAKIGITKDLGFGVLGVSAISTNARGDCSVTASPFQPYCNAYGKDLGAGRGVVTFTRTF